MELNRRRHRRRCKKILDVDEDKKTKAAAAGTGAYNLLRGMRKMSFLIQFWNLDLMSKTNFWIAYAMVK